MSCVRFACASLCVPLSAGLEPRWVSTDGKTDSALQSAFATHKRCAEGIQTYETIGHLKRHQLVPFTRLSVLSCASFRPNCGLLFCTEVCRKSACGGEVSTLGLFVRCPQWPKEWRKRSRQGNGNFLSEYAWSGRMSWQDCRLSSSRGGHSATASQSASRPATWRRVNNDRPSRQHDDDREHGEKKWPSLGRASWLPRWLPARAASAASVSSLGVL
jgi:hypothetical protein